MALYVFSKNGMGSYEDGTGMREDMHMQAFNIFNYQAGVVLSTDLAVTETSPASMAVKVAAGRCFVQNSSYTVNTANSTKYWGVLAEETTVSVDTNTSGSTRIDLVTIKVDTVTAPNAYATNIASVVVVKGTPGAGTPALPNNSLLIATLTIPTATTTTITTAMIADNRVLYGTTYTKNAAGNIEVREGSITRGVIRVIVPPTGDLNDALTNADYTSTYEVHLIAKGEATSSSSTTNSYLLTSTPTVNATMEALIGVGGMPTIYSTSGGTAFFTISSIGARVENLCLNIEGSTPSVGIIIGTQIFVKNILGITGSSSDEVVRLSGNGSTVDGLTSFNLLGSGPKLFTCSGLYNKIRAAAVPPQTGTTWTITGNYNIAEVICDTAGTNSGTGNNVTEVVF